MNRGRIDSAAAGGDQANRVSAVAACKGCREAARREATTEGTEAKCQFGLQRESANRAIGRVYSFQRRRSTL